MDRIVTYLTAFLLSFPIGVTYSANGLTTAQLREICINESFDHNIYCGAYIQGNIAGTVTSSSIAARNTKNERSWSLTHFEAGRQLINICFPNQFSIEQASALVVKYINENPEIWHEPAATSVFSAFQKAFPCSE